MDTKRHLLSVAETQVTVPGFFNFSDCVYLYASSIKFAVNSTSGEFFNSSYTASGKCASNASTWVCFLFSKVASRIFIAFYNGWSWSLIYFLGREWKRCTFCHLTGKFYYAWEIECFILLTGPPGQIDYFGDTNHQCSKQRLLLKRKHVIIHRYHVWHVKRMWAKNPTTTLTTVTKETERFSRIAIGFPAVDLLWTLPVK